MSVVLLLSIILATQLPPNTFGKSSSKVGAAGTEVPASEIEADDESRMRRHSNSDDDDFLINKLSREYVTSNLLDSTATSCNK